MPRAPVIVCDVSECAGFVELVYTLCLCLSVGDIIIKR